MAAEPIPRLFGSYLLTERLGSDALGKTYRARRADDSRAFFRLRIFDAPGLDAEPVLTAIEQNGAVHDFLKNPAIVQEAELDSVEGDAFMAYIERGGRTLDSLLAASLARPFPIPVEHALLIAEKVATGLDHAYNTKIDGERTLHGLLWPGFVEISDEGEIRLAGFGIAEGILASRGTPAVRQLLYPYLAPEVRESGKPSRVGDVYSTAALLVTMLGGTPPPLEKAADAVGDIQLFGQGSAVPADIAVVLRTALAESTENRYETAGALRREIGKLLFSGRYAPSTFNLAFFLNNLFKDEIARELARRVEESDLDASRYPRQISTPRQSRKVATPRFGASPFNAEAQVHDVEKKPFPLLAVLGGTGALIVVTLFVFLTLHAKTPKPVVIRKTPFSEEETSATTTSATTTATTSAITSATTSATTTGTASATAPAKPAAPSQPTGGMTAAQYKQAVDQRLAEGMQKLEQEQKAKEARAAAQARAVALKPQPTAVASNIAAPRPIPVAGSAPPGLPEPIAIAPAPVAPAVHRGDLVPIGEVDSAPEISNVVKPEYPPVAKRMGASGTVILSVLVAENGKPAEVKILRDAGGNTGLGQAAVSAVRKWTFKPATKGGVAVRTWMTVPIPFIL
jgi:TonB family protein